MLTIIGRSAEVRRTAAEALRRRDPRDYLGLLIGMVRKPLKYEVRPGSQRNSPGQLFVEGERYNINRQYVIESGTLDIMSPIPQRLFDSSVPFDPFGPQNVRLAMQGMAWMMPGATMPTVGPATALPQNAHASPAAKAVAGGGIPGGQQAMINTEVMSFEALAAQRDIVIAQRMMALDQVIELSRQQLRNDIQAVEAYNADVLRVNDLAVPILTYLTGLDLGTSPEPWEAWWTDQRGYAYTTPDPSSKPTYTDFVENPFIIPHHSCFGAGTSVHTLDGPRAIESIRLGDQVLSQDARTGKLAFTSVVAVFHNKPAATLRIKLADQAIVVTAIHRFWKAGTGWTMVARAETRRHPPHDRRDGSGHRGRSGFGPAGLQPGGRRRAELLRRPARCAGARQQHGPAGERTVRRRQGAGDRDDDCSQAHKVHARPLNHRAGF